MHKYTEVDVFSPTPYLGNLLAVVHDAAELTGHEMQRFAKWTNLAETTFLLDPTSSAADYRLRIFSAVQEFPFAGHPTLGSALAWLAAGGVPKTAGVIVQECGAGLVPIRVEGSRLSFAAPPLTRFEPLDDVLVDRVSAVLGISRQRMVDTSWLVNGPEWIGVRLSTAQEVLSLNPNPSDLGSLSIGVIGPHEPGNEAQFEVRAFLGGDPMPEDPVTGSLNAAFAQWMVRSGVVNENYIAAQGTAIGYEGRVHITVDRDVIWVGGDVTLCIRGEVVL